MLETAIEAASEAGKLLRKNFGTTLVVNQATHHDIKLEIDEQAQAVITRVILADFPAHCILGEEGTSGNPNGDVRWVVDPLDGTVNYFYGIPHYAVSIAAQVRKSAGVVGRMPSRGEHEVPADGSGPTTAPEWETVAGVVYDPEVDEMFTAAEGGPATLNSRPIRVSDRAELSEAIMSIGFFKSTETIRRSLKDFSGLIERVRKVRIMGAAALDVVYVASGRYDAYMEYGIKLWDIAAGQLILERAGGIAEVRPAAEPHTFDVRMTNGKLKLSL